MLDVIAASSESVLITQRSAGRDDWQMTGSSYDGQRPMWFSMVQVFVDAYPQPTRGLHFSAGIGPAAFQFGSKRAQLDSSSSSSSTSDKTEYGVGASLAAGWEGWMSPQWSLGGVLTLNVAQVFGEPSLYGGTTGSGARTPSRCSRPRSCSRPPTTEPSGRHRGRRVQNARNPVQRIRHPTESPPQRGQMEDARAQGDAAA